MRKSTRTEKINVWPIGSANLVQEWKGVPLPHKFIGAYCGYSFYKTRHGVFAVPGYAFQEYDPVRKVKN